MAQGSAQEGMVTGQGDTCISMLSFSKYRIQDKKDKKIMNM